MTDPQLAWECFFGPATPYQYRLRGPGAWKGAREAIMTQWERTYYPLKSRPLPTIPSKSKSSYVFAAIIFALIAVVLYCIF